MKTLDCKETVECRSCGCKLGIEDGDVFVIPSFTGKKENTNYIQCLVCKQIQAHRAHSVVAVPLPDYQQKNSVLQQFKSSVRQRIEKFPEEYRLVYVVCIYNSSRGYPAKLAETYVCVDYFEAARFAKDVPSHYMAVGDDYDRVSSGPIQVFVIPGMEYEFLKLGTICLSQAPEYYGLVPFVKPEKSS